MSSLQISLLQTYNKGLCSWWDMKGLEVALSDNILHKLRDKKESSHCSVVIFWNDNLSTEKGKTIYPLFSYVFKLVETNMLEAVRKV